MTKQLWPFPPATYINDDNELRQLGTQLAGEPLLALDTESNSLHAYHEQLCLIQISTRTEDYIIDPLRILDMQPLGSLLADARIEKVFHAAEYDLACLKRDFGFEVSNLFDTMIAARIRGYKAIGLGTLLETCFSVKLDKNHQRDDWGRRPLPEPSLWYAQMDTHYLPPLRDYFYEELESNGQLQEAREAFAEMAQTHPSSGRHFDPDGYWAMGVPVGLSRKQMAILRELYLLREQLAERRNVPPFKVFGNKTLVEIAQLDPTESSQLRAIRGMSPAQVRRYGRQLIQAVERGRNNRLPAPPRPERPDPVLAERYAILHAWRKSRAEQRGVESDVIISRQALWEIARQCPKTREALSTIPGIGPWRLETYGEDLLAITERFKVNGE